MSERRGIRLEFIRNSILSLNDTLKNEFMKFTLVRFCAKILNFQIAVFIQSPSHSALPTSFRNHQKKKLKRKNDQINA